MRIPKKKPQTRLDFLELFKINKGVILRLMVGNMDLGDISIIKYMAQFIYRELKHEFGEEVEIECVDVVPVVDSDNSKK